MPRKICRVRRPNDYLVMENRSQYRKRIHLKGFDYSDTSSIYFIALCTANKKPYFETEKLTQIIEDEMEFRRVAGQIKLYCYCIMPDHLHILLSLTSSYRKSLQDWVSTFKRYTSRTVNTSFGISPLWQKNFYDHIVRREESLLKMVEYILNNPIRKGMASEWHAYPHSKVVDPLPI